MIGYYQSGGDGTGVRWVSGYRPGRSPEEIRERKNQSRRRARADKAAGIKRCRLCGTDLPAASVRIECDECVVMLEEKAKANVALSVRRRIARLRHGYSERAAESLIK